MRVEEGIYYILQTVFGNEIYPVQHPDPDGLINSVSDTYAIYSKIGGQSYNTLEGDTGLSRVRMQVSIYSTSYDDLKTKEANVNLVMQLANTNANSLVDPYNTLGALVNVSSTVPTDGYENDTKRFYVHMDFYVWEKV